MDTEPFFIKVAAMLSEVSGRCIPEISMTTSLTDDLGMDSLDLVELVMKMEETFGIQVSDEQAERLATVEDVVTFIAEAKAPA